MEMVYFTNSASDVLLRSFDYESSQSVANETDILTF